MKRMKRMKRMEHVSKAIALLLVSVMGLSACGSQQSEADDSSKKEETNKQDASDVQNYWEMLDSVSDTSELPDWTGDTLEVTVWVAGGTETIFGAISDTNVTFKELERVTGVKFNVEDSFGNGGDSIDAKMPKLVASGDFPTMVYAWDCSSQMTELFEHGYLADLTEYYEDGSLDQMEYWVPSDVFGDVIYSNMKSEDGRYYMIPATINSISQFYDAYGYSPEEYDSGYYYTYMESPTNSRGYPSNSGTVYIRDDVLQALYPDALTMEDIRQIYMENGTFTEEEVYDVKLENYEEFFDLLRDVKELLKSGDYVGLDGKALEVTYGPNADTDNWNWMSVLPQLVAGQPMDVNYFTNINNEATKASEMMERTFMTEEVVGYMKGLNALVNEDVISQTSLVDNAATFSEKCLNGHYAVYYGYVDDPANIDGGEEGWAYRPLYVRDYLWEDLGGYYSVSGSAYWGIFKDSVTEEQMDQLIHCINYLNSEVGEKNFIWGPESAGLFEEDENGIRTYTDSELMAAMVAKEDNKAPLKYGIKCNTVSEPAFSTIPLGSGGRFFSYQYMNAETAERRESDARLYYNPGVLGNGSMYEIHTMIATNSSAHGFGAQNVEGMAQWWSARAGFENQLKRTIATTPDKFEQELNNLLQYSIDNGMTDEALEEFGEKFYEANKEYFPNVSAD